MQFLGLMRIEPVLRRLASICSTIDEINALLDALEASEEHQCASNESNLVSAQSILILKLQDTSFSADVNILQVESPATVSMIRSYSTADTAVEGIEASTEAMMAYYIEKLMWTLNHAYEKLSTFHQCYEEDISKAHVFFKEKLVGHKFPFYHEARDWLADCLELIDTVNSEISLSGQDDLAYFAHPSTYARDPITEVHRFLGIEHLFRGPGQISPSEAHVILDAVLDGELGRYIEVKPELKHFVYEPGGSAPYIFGRKGQYFVSLKAGAQDTLKDFSMYLAVILSILRPTDSYGALASSAVAITSALVTSIWKSFRILGVESGAQCIVTAISRYHSRHNKWPELSVFAEDIGISCLKSTECHFHQNDIGSVTVPCSMSPDYLEKGVKSLVGLGVLREIDINVYALVT